MRLGGITYTVAEANKSTFAKTKLTGSDISFEERDQYPTLRLKRSKTNVEHTWMEIILAATGEQTYLVAALRRIFIQDPRSPNAPLFRLSSVAFSRENVLAILKKCIASTVPSESDFSSHSFCKGAVRHAANNGMLDESIQRLGVAGHLTPSTFISLPHLKRYWAWISASRIASPWQFSGQWYWRLW